MLRWHEVNLHMVVNQLLDGNPTRSDTQAVSYLLGNHHLLHAGCRFAQLPLEWPK